jgi:GntR family transcriptional repressor for pyruvate dehydrogenase complex
MTAARSTRSKPRRDLDDDALIAGRDSSDRSDPLDGIASEGIVPTRLADAVLARLAQAIASGRLKPGDPVPSESRIASAFGVSKQIAREAIRELAALGVIHVQQGKTSRIRAVDGTPLGRFYRLAVGDGIDGLRQVVELRRVIEPGIAALAAERRTSDDIAELRDILTRMHAAIGDASAWIEADAAFHHALGRICGNRLISLQLEALSPVIRRMLEQFNRRHARSVDDWQATWRRHEKVVTAIESGHPDKAFAAMAAHFEQAPAALLALERLMEGADDHGA